MTLLQLMQNAISEPSLLGTIGASAGIGTTIGSIVTMGVQKLFSRKRDKTDIVTSQVQMLDNVNQKLNSVVEQLQDIACYREPCKKRINGNENTKTEKP